MKKIIILFLSLFIIGLSAYFIWFFKYQDTIDGYVLSSGKQGIWIVESIGLKSPPDLKGKSAKEIAEMYKFKGVTSELPLPNRMVHSRYKVGQKVRIYYTGGVYLTAPGDLDSPKLIIKLKE